MTRNFTLAALALAGTLSFAAPAMANDVTVTLTKEEAQSWAIVAPAMDNCVAGSALRNDFEACRQLGRFLQNFAAKVNAVAAAATPTGPQTPLPTNPPTPTQSAPPAAVAPPPPTQTAPPPPKASQ